MAEVEIGKVMEENLIDSVTILAGRMEDLMLSESGQPEVVGPENPEYEELLCCVYDLLYQRNPELIRWQRIVINPPELLRGARKTFFVNFTNICARMRREPQHVMSFLLTELATSGSTDGQFRLVVEGRFGPHNFELLLRKYHNKFVVCDGCKSCDTILSKSKENRILFLECQDCGSTRSVAPIKVGCVARLGRRKAAGRT
ncbi:OLC1v1019392C1 [Oldenlandia corymbosa var. corymbosa]|uniref:Eukaryotic translation initiation factor 2 subunit beta n=1 Tax=Oldenlandia corymbosa var. corymbosa TaxID=529605 RepID=A0AAV1EDY2_OLDCO|nr:OLC1v1019392C1 [Oldenlandia corymbosa var. corymbosa]